MFQTNTEQKLQQMEEMLKKMRISCEEGCLYRPEHSYDLDIQKLGFPEELYSIM